MTTKCPYDKIYIQRYKNKGKNIPFPRLGDFGEARIYSYL